jgi:hypothetical protein
MPRAAYVIALTLMLLTGIVVGQLRSLGPTRSEAMPAEDPLAQRAAANYYDAVNSLLASGDAVSLRAVLHQNFVDHSGSSQDASTAHELESQLLSLSGTLPGIQITPATITVQNAVVASNVSFTGTTQQITDDLTAEFENPPPAFEMLRIADGKVIERWAGPALSAPATVDSLTSLDASEPATAFRELRFDRLTFARFAQQTVAIHAGTFLFIESGVVQYHFSTELVGKPGNEAASENGGELRAGDILRIPAAEPYSLVNNGLHDATVLRLTTLFADNSSPISTTLSNAPAPGVTRELLMSGAGIRPLQDAFQIDLLLVTLSPGAVITDHRVVEAEMLLAVDGRIEADISDGEVGVLTEQATIDRRTESLVLARGQGIAVYPKTGVAYRAASSTPATFWLVTVNRVADVPQGTDTLPLSLDTGGS